MDSVIDITPRHTGRDAGGAEYMKSGGRIIMTGSAWASVS